MTLFSHGVDRDLEPLPPDCCGMKHFNKSSERLEAVLLTFSPMLITNSILCVKLDSGIFTSSLVHKEEGANRLTRSY